MTEQKLTFTKLTTTKQPEGSCPYTGDVPFTGAEYVRKCKLLPDLVSCTYWREKEIFERCWTKKAEDEQTKQS